MFPRLSSPDLLKTAEVGFDVSIPDPLKDNSADARDLDFILKRGVASIPADQLALKAEIEDTLTTLQVIFPDRKWSSGRSSKTAEQRRFEQYQYKLLSLAQVGLQATPAYPAVANQALTALQSQIMAREGGRVKNGYMKKLGLWAGVFILIGIAIFTVLSVDRSGDDALHRYRNLYPLLAGCMMGTWLSFGIRRVFLTFNDLGRLENDLLEPSIRLIFTGLMTLIIGLIFICGMVNVTIGGFSTESLLTSASRALLIGIFCGISEQALPGTLTRRASQFMSELGGK